MSKHQYPLLQSLLALLLITVAAIVQAAEQQLEIFSLQHRLAEELLPNLLPFVDKQGVISAKGNQLIIRTSDNNLKELTRLVQRLDQPIKRLLIEVRQPLISSRSNHQADISGDASLPGKNAQTRLRTYGTSSRDTAASTQQIQVLEGHTALIRTSQLVPMGKKQLRSSGQVESIVGQQDVSSGFKVTPRLNGDTVLLEIMPFSSDQASTGGGVINQQQAFTTVSTKLGQWFEIASTSASSQQNGRQAVYKTHERDQQQRQILIRVTEQ